MAVVVGAALALLLVCLVAALLGAVGWWNPYLGWAVALAGFAGAVRSLRRLPSLRLDRVSAAGLLLVTVAAGVWWSATSSQQVLPRRDGGSNLQAAVSLADSGRRAVDVDPRAIGAPTTLEIPGIVVSSPAFYQVGSPADPSVQPQFVIGPAAVYSLGRPVGLGAMVDLAAWAMAGAVLGLGLLTSLTVGARWGPVAAAATALVFPVVHTARTTLSEPLAELTLVAGLLALTLAARTSGPQARRWGAVAGVLVGGTILVRIDALREVVLLLPVLAAYAALRRPWVRDAGAGLALSTGIAVALAWWQSYHYLGDIAASLLPLVAGGLVVLVASAGLLRLGRTGRLGCLARLLSSPGAARLPGVVAAGVVLLGLGLASRPLWQVVRQNPNDPGSRYVAAMQLREGLTVDGGRTYAEHTVAWLSWWVGPLALLIALAALAALAHRVVATALSAPGDSTPGGRGVPPTWTGALVVATGSTLLTLYRPGITPDHPWADRRLLIALPLVVVLVVAAAAGVRRALGPRRGAPLAGVLVLALVVPAALATWPHRGERVEAGSAGAVAGVCRALQPDDVVLAVDARAANEWPQVVRGMCGRPALSTTGTLRRDPSALAAAVTRVATAVSDRGGRLVLLAADSAEGLGALGGVDVRQVSGSVVLEDPHLLTRRPDSLDPLPITVWLASRTPGP